MEIMKLDLNEHFLNALHIMEDTDRNVFVTGRAGTGKSTLLQHFRNNTKKAIAVLGEWRGIWSTPFTGLINNLQGQ